MRILFLLTTFLCFSFLAQSQKFNCEDYRIGSFIMAETIDDNPFEFLIIRTNRSQKEVLLSGPEGTEYLLDTLYTHVLWDSKNCQYTLTLDSVQTKKSLFTKLKMVGTSIVIDIGAKENNCFHFKAKASNSEYSYSSKMCRLEEEAIIQEEQEENDIEE